MNLQLNEKNVALLTREEVLSFIDQEDKVTLLFEKGFKRNSDTEDVFRGLMGDEAFEENIEMLDALECEGEVRHTFFLSNAKVESPFNERGMVKRLLQDNHWTAIILHDRPLKDGFYAKIENREKV